MEKEISLLDSAVLGIVEGFTEYLPISSTGHLILTARALGLPENDSGVDAFLIVIQAGAILAVLGLYRKNVLLMLKGLIGKSPEGLRLFGLLMTALMPAVIVALPLEHFIKEKLFNPGPVAGALAVGGIVMILVDYVRKRRAPADADGMDAGRPLNIASITFKMALIIGLAQCLAMWPGTSRSMVTLVAGMMVGLKPKAAAEFSFLLALPTLGGATAKDLYSHGGHILDVTGTSGLVVGSVVACVVAAISIKFLLHYLTRHGLSVFGYYRLILAVLVFIYM